MAETPETHRVREILATAKPLAAEYYRLTGKPLGITGEIAEYVAAETLGLELAPPRTKGFDAVRKTEAGGERIQIKGRAYGENTNPGQRVGAIKRGSPCDRMLLVLLEVEERLSLPGSKARARGALAVSEFKRIAERVWPFTEK